MICPAKVERIEYDPNRTAYIALIKYEKGDFSYIICPQNLKVNDVVVSSDNYRNKNWKLFEIKKYSNGYSYS